MFGLQPLHFLIILIVALIIFGPNQLPKLARMLGETLREFRKATDELKESLDVSQTPTVPAPEPVRPTLVLPKPPWRIFLSSVMKDMAEERARVKKAIESLPDLAQAWTWEEGSYASPLKTPEEEYLPEVSACHIFLLIVKDDITTPVRREYETARQANKPMLVFVKKCERTQSAQELVDALGKEMTYAVFVDADEPDRLADLDDKVRKAVARLVIDKFEIDEAKRHVLEEQITALEQQITERDWRLAERDKKIGQLEKEKLILATTTVAGPIVTAAVISATSQPTVTNSAPVDTSPPRIQVTTPEPPRIETPLSPVKIGKDGKRMILIPAGEFLRGTSDADILEMNLRFGWKTEWFDDEKPQHRIYLDAYYIDETPVTNADYKRFVDATGCGVPFNGVWKEAKPFNWDESRRTFPLGKGNHPVVLVSWDDAQDYAHWAGKRLPTETEWEKAARGGLFLDGDELRQQSNPSPRRYYPWGNEQPGKYSPRGNSPYGVMDMAGNVLEWCADRWDPDYYKDTNGQSRNPQGPSGFLTGLRVLRGGRCAYRMSNVINLYMNYGFRCVMSVEK